MARFNGLLVVIFLFTQQQTAVAKVLRGDQGRMDTGSYTRTPTKMTGDQQKAVVDKHNQLRAQHNATHQPCTAADMEAMVWDDQLAQDAQAYADGCVGDHADGAGSKFGENLWIQFPDMAYTTKDLVSGVQSWQDEIVDTVWGINDRKVTSKPVDKCTDRSGDHCNVGHYFQVIWAKSNKIGCGVAACSSGFTVSGSDLGTGVLMICRYDKAASLGAGETNSLPYIYGKPCAACPDHCSNGLCTATPTRCLDKLGGDNTINIGGKEFTSCPDLVKAHAADSQMPWCTKLAPMMKADNTCALSCRKCTVPAGVGAIGSCDGADATKEVVNDGKEAEGETKQDDGKGEGVDEGKDANVQKEGEGTGGEHVKDKDAGEDDDSWGNWTSSEDEEHHQKTHGDEEEAEGSWTDPWAGMPEGDNDDWYWEVHNKSPRPK